LSRGLLIVLLTGLVAACQSARASSPPLDVECTSGLSFAQRVHELAARDDPELTQLSAQLAQSHSLEQNQLVMASLAGVLSRQEADLRALRPPPGDVAIVESLIAADDSLRAVAAGLATAGVDAQVKRRGDFLAAAQNRQQAARQVELRAQFITSECQ
jgi:hypothetical protein